MTALGKLVRSTAFRLTLVYLLIFALYAAALLAYFALNTGRLITEQITETVDAEIAGLTEQYTIGGAGASSSLIVENRALRPGSSLYLVTAPTGQALAGNVGSLAPGVLDKTGWSETVYRRLDEQDTAEHSALVRVTQLSGGFRLLVGRDLEERARMREIVVAAARGSLALVVVLGLAGGFFVTRRVLKRFDAMTDDHAAHHGRRPVRAAPGHRHRRRARSSRHQPQRHAGAHRGADARLEGSLRQHRA